MVDRLSPVPLWAQIRDGLKEEIASGRWSPGEQIPSEPAISAHFSIARSTVRQALAQLESEGLIRKDHGRGTFVSSHARTPWLLQSALGFYEEALRAGRVVRTQVLTSELATLPEWAANLLGVAAGSPGFLLERLRWVDGDLAMYVVTYLPEHLADTVLEANLESGSLYQNLAERRGLYVAGSRRTVEATAADEGLAELLKIRPGAPLLLVESVSWDESRSPFECYRCWHRADRTKIEVYAGAPATGPAGSESPRRKTLPATLRRSAITGSEGEMEDARREARTRSGRG
jgi:GntR family transcriptional regulator